jgi:hypothetical protein
MSEMKWGEKEDVGGQQKVSNNELKKDFFWTYSYTHNTRCRDIYEYCLCADFDIQVLAYLIVL